MKNNCKNCYVEIKKRNWGTSAIFLTILLGGAVLFVSTFLIVAMGDKITLPLSLRETAIIFFGLLNMAMGVIVTIFGYWALSSDFCFETRKVKVKSLKGGKLN